MDAVVRCEDDPAIRALVVTGAGPRFFCAGADLKGFYAEGSELKSRVSIFHAVLSRLVRAGDQWCGSRRRQAISAFAAKRTPIFSGR
jgi:enoyl-CoA hydratase/carnithine racemase